MKSYSITENFNHYFKIEFAHSKQLVNQAFKIRHSVYCKELNWEPLQSNEMETDQYDDYSFHCLLRHKRTGNYAGCARLVIPPIENPNLKLPFEQHCLHTARTDVVDSAKLPRGSFGEISRVAVLSSFRRRKKNRTRLTYSMK